MGCQILGISVNGAEANRTFAEKLGLTFPLLCDTDKAVSREYGVLSFLRLPRRTTFVVDASGIIRHIDRGSQAMDPTLTRQACKLLAPHSE